MDFIKTPTKGMRDITPKNMELREYVLKIMKETYQKFGFELIQTPAVEHIENLIGSKGGENEKLIFKIMKRGDKLHFENDDFDSLVDSALRYDLTVPLARFYANNKEELSSPFRSFQIGNVYRAERSQKGRFREFMQCDLDILGEKENLAEIELITSVVTFLKKLDFKEFTIKLNDRRILTSMVESVNFPIEKKDQILIILDKIDKIGTEGIEKELESLELNKENIKKYINLLNENRNSLKDFCSKINVEEKVIKNLEEIIGTVNKILDVNLVFDPTLVRGMGYYTGPIFEIEVEDLASSIGGGGRYDKMIGNFINMEVPSCGFSIGFERLLLLLEERGFKVPKEQEKIAIIIKEETSLESAFLEAKKLREENKIVKVLKRSKNFKFQKESLEQNHYHIEER